MWSVRRHALWLFVAGLVVHACVVGVVHIRTGSVRGYAFNSLDCGEYYRIAANLLDHGLFSRRDDPPFTPDAWRTPGYPLFLAAAMLVVGRSPAALIIVQQALSILSVLLLYHIARRRMSASRAAVVAAAFLLEPYHLLYSTWLMSTTLFVAVLLLTWHALQLAMDRRGSPWFALTGVLSGMLVLVRPIGILIPLVVLGCLLVAAFPRHGTADRKRGSRASWAAVCLFCTASAAVTGTWMIRNHAVTGRLALSEQSGVVLAYFKATEVVLWREGRTADRYVETSLNPANAEQPHRVWDGIDTRLRQRFPDLSDSERAALSWRNLAQGNTTTVDSFMISDGLARIGWSYLLESPVSTVACYLARCAEILAFPINLAIRPPNGLDVNRWRSFGVASPYVGLCVLAIWTLIRRGGPAVEILFPLGAVLALLLTTTPQIDPRFRVPMIPLLLVIALRGRTGRRQL